ncbi:MAG: hypothetical protein JWN48_3050 [Myxococcaceae bacterium]|nr:hypothetical protein [Myxococcaceae bacterium]
MANWNKPHWLSLDRSALAFALLIAVLACALPLTRTLGPESALLLSLTLSPWASAVAARRALRSAGKYTGALLAENIGMSWLLLALPVLLLFANGLWVDPCDPIGGLRFIALGPLASLTLSALVGTLAGSALRSAGWATAVAVLSPLFDAARAASGFVRSPAIFAYGHFFGYFPGTFYDRKVDVPDAWLSHRLQTGLIALGLWALLTAAREPVGGRLSAARLVEQRVTLALAAAAAFFSTWIARQASALHHVSSSASISAQLGSIIETAHCRAVLPRELPSGSAQRLAEDCEFRIQQLEQLLGVRENARITAFFFRSPEEKRDLMGAARVYIAKPWRREVYLQLADYPHPVLAHELAHIVARHAASGPFGVPGRLGGLIPEPTLIEGTAVALEPHARDELTPHQWAKAAQAAGLAPQLSSLLGLSFFGTNQALAYTLAGSFLRFVLETRGAESLRRVYRDASVERALGKPFSVLEREWKAYLAKVPLPERAQALARLRFERPGVWSQVCPHLIEQLDGELGAALSAGDLEQAMRKCQAVLAIDQHDSDTRVTLASVLAQRGELDQARAQIGRLEQQPKAPSPTIARAKTAIADAEFATGEYQPAQVAYRALLEQPQPEHDIRQLEVKLLALEAGEPARSLLREYLVADPHGRSDPRTAMHLIRELDLVRTDGLARYLEARQLRAANRFDVVQSLLRDALARGLPSQRLRVEALKMQVQAAFATGALSEAEAVASQLEQREGATLAEVAEAKDWQERIAFRRGGAR